MSKKEPIVGYIYTVRELQEFAVNEMYNSVSEHTDKADPKVGAVLADENFRFICSAHRGELRAGDHAEFTAIERKCRDRKLDGCIVFATLEPCYERKFPKLGCSFRITNARIGKVYIGVHDPDPTVAGKGENLLRSKGVEIDYFDKDLQDKIYAANTEFIAQAIERAKKSDLEELNVGKGIMETVLPHFDLKDLSEEAQQLFIDKLKIGYTVGSDEFNKLLLKWELLDTDRNNVVRPTGWGLLLFGKNPTEKYSQARIKFTVITEYGTAPKTQDFIGPLVLIPPKIEEYLGFIFPKIIDRRHFEHKEIREISMKLLREVIINAIVHRDYQIANAQILIEITPQNIIIKSPGKPIVSIEKMQNFTAPSVSRNPKLADIFYNMNYIERRGIGMDEVKQYKPKPIYCIDEIYTVLRIVKAEKNTVAEKLNVNEKNIYYYLRKSKLKHSKTEIAKKLSMEEKTVQRCLKNLINKELIFSEGQSVAIKYFVVHNESGQKRDKSGTKARQSETKRNNVEQSEKSDKSGTKAGHKIK
jgi:ATP-dependent DNA helicase RecG